MDNMRIEETLIKMDARDIVHSFQPLRVKALKPLLNSLLAFISFHIKYSNSMNFLALFYIIKQFFHIE